VVDSVAEGAVGIDWRGSVADVAGDRAPLDRADRPEAGAVGKRYSAPIDHDRLPTRQEAYQQARADFEVSRGRGRGTPLDASAMLPDDIAFLRLRRRMRRGQGLMGRNRIMARLLTHPARCDWRPMSRPRTCPTPGPASDYGPPPDRPDGTPIPCFDGPPTREQTVQGQLGDCGVIATIGAIAGHRPEAIRDCVRPNDDGSYEVRLHETR
jgi:hypothetical protein